MLSPVIIFNFFIILFSGSPLSIPNSPPTSGTVSISASRLDRQIMDNPVSFYFAKGLAPSTKKVIQIHSESLSPFCSANNLQLIPLSESSLSQFVSVLANSSLKYQTIKCYRVRHLQISAGLQDPFTLPMPHLKLVLRGIKRHQSELFSQFLYESFRM